LDLVLSKNKALSILEFQKVITDDMVALVNTLESDKKFHLRYEVKLFNNKSYKVYVKMSLNQIFNIMNQKQN